MSLVTLCDVTVSPSDLKPKTRRALRWSDAYTAPFRSGMWRPSLLQVSANDGMGDDFHASRRSRFNSNVLFKRLNRAGVGGLTATLASLSMRRKRWSGHAWTRGRLSEFSSERSKRDQGEGGPTAQITRPQLQSSLARVRELHFPWRVPPAMAVAVPTLAGISLQAGIDLRRFAGAVFLHFKRASNWKSFA